MTHSSSKGTDSSTGLLPPTPLVDDPLRHPASGTLHDAGFRLVRPLVAVPSSFQPGRVMIGTLLVAILMTLGGLWDGLLGAGQSASGVSAAQGSGNAAATSADAVPARTFAWVAAEVAGGVDGALMAVVRAEPRTALETSGRLLFRLPVLLWQDNRTLAIGYGLLALAASALCGGALARMAAMQSANGTRLPASEAMIFAWRRCPRLLGTVLLPLGLVLFLALLLLIPGLLLRVPGLNVLAALFQGLWFLVALIAAFALAGTLLALPLLPAAVACERDDAIEAVQRCVSYWLVRPLHLLAMLATSLIGIALGYVVVTWLASTAAGLSASTVGAWSPQAQATMIEPLGVARWEASRPSAAALGMDSASSGSSQGATARAATAVIGWWSRLLALIVAGWVVSAVMTCATQMYLAVRESADGQDPEEIEG